MRKVLVLGAAAAAGLAVWRRVQQDRADQELWAQATDTVDAGARSSGEPPTSTSSTPAGP